MRWQHTWSDRVLLTAQSRAWIILTPQVESTIALLALLKLGEDAPRITPLPAHTRIEDLPLTESAAPLLLGPLTQIGKIAAPAIQTVAYEDIAGLPLHFLRPLLQKSFRNIGRR